ncbi:Microtubule binding protein YTM1 (contains WD40 repeats) [Handroanthus impetiginosus]|uniref:Microtubule binding protein YTM1 (Contains WD40 repeats) n=1 Tax=Handroanthus impetiginosus TaxID=429701 RepID=A0A2G9HUZ6_9LAMI|nr:Microtubule binding protein YTM1 (contains WD40 repeats) [Handroanthus impetiginosus]
MDNFLSFPSDKPQDSDQSRSNLNSDSSSNSSLASQSSLPSVPSLTSSLDLPTAGAAAHHRCLATLKGHSSYIFSLVLAGKHLYSGGSDGEIRVWDRNPCSYTPSHNHTISDGAKSAVKSIFVLSDKLYTAHQDHKIRVWKINDSGEKYKMITVLPTISDQFMRLFSGKNYVKVRRHKTSTWVHHVDAVSSLALTKDGSFLYSVSWDRTLKVWRTSDFKCLESVQNAHDDAINAVVLSNDSFLYTGSADRRIKVWKKKDGEKKQSLVSTLEKHKSAVNALALSSDGSVLYSGACDRSIIVWEKGGGGGAHMTVAGALRGHTKAILCLAVVSDLLCSGSADRTVRVWRRGSGNSYSCLAVLEGHRHPVKCLAAAFDSNYGRSNGDSGKSCLVYSGSLDFEIKVWRISVL